MKEAFGTNNAIMSKDSIYFAMIRTPGIVDFSKLPVLQAIISSFEKEYDLIHIDLTYFFELKGFQSILVKTSIEIF